MGVSGTVLDVPNASIGHPPPKPPTTFATGESGLLVSWSGESAIESSEKGDRAIDVDVDMGEASAWLLGVLLVFVWLLAG